MIKVATQRRRMNATKEADDLFSEMVRERDERCVRCGSQERLTAAHIWSRRYRSIRWRLENSICLCWPCHYFMGLHPAEWAVWCEERRFCDMGVCLYRGVMHETGQYAHTGDAYTYAQLRWRALNDEPERAVDALARLKSLSEEG